MTQLIRLSLVEGDRVVVRDDCGSEAEHEVTRSPWQLGHGAWVVGLAGIAGGYALDRVVSLLPPRNPDAAIARLRCAVAILRELRGATRR